MTQLSPSPKSTLKANLKADLNTFVSKARQACRDGHAGGVALILFDLGRCLWVGEKVERLSKDPVENIRRRCREYMTFLDFWKRTFPDRRGAPGFTLGTDRPWGSVEDRTQNLYSSLWVKFDKKTYFREAAALLRVRLRRNGIPLKSLQGKSCLDAGCGSGRYSVALRGMGAKDVVGLDLGVLGLKDARARVAQAGITGVSFSTGSVLKIPFKDDRFDFVMSNGVLHHTRDTLQGLREMRRVMRPGGEGWFYVYNSDGLYWAVRKAMRRVAAVIPPEFMRQTLSSFGIHSNRIFLYMDALYVPIENNYTREEAEVLIQRAGFTRWKFLHRGADRDLCEAVARGDAGARAMYGRYGDLRFWVKK